MGHRWPRPAHFDADVGFVLCSCGVSMLERVALIGLVEPSLARVCGSSDLRLISVFAVQQLQIGAELGKFLCTVDQPWWPNTLFCSLQPGNNSS